MAGMITGKMIETQHVLVPNVDEKNLLYADLGDTNWVV